MKLVTLEEMKMIEKEAISAGSSIEKLMEKAGEGIADFIRDVFSDTSELILGLVGSGNNGGDTLVALSILAKAGFQSCAILVRPRPANDPLVQRLVKKGGQVKDASVVDIKDLEVWFDEASVLLDGIIGAGISLPLKPEIASFLDKIMPYTMEIPVVAVDCPSGVDLETGQAAPETIPADFTLCMGAVKEGLLHQPALALAGILEIVDLGLPAKVTSWKENHSEVVSGEMVTKMLPKRASDAHKGSFGTATIVGGSMNFTGAVLLAGSAAYRVGAGLVRLAIPGPLYPALAGHIPEATWLILPHEQGVIHEDAVAVIRDNLEKTSAMLLGPGWGREETTKEFLKKLISAPSTQPHKGRIGFLEQAVEGNKRQNPLPPLVIDADGLQLLSRVDGWKDLLPKETILTPHPGEMAALTGMEINEIQANRLETARKFAQEWKQVVVLKGALTVVASPGGQTYMIPVATSALAKAGTGDVLAGMISGFRCQGMSALEAAICGAWVHAQAGLLAVESVGDEAAVMASDVIAAIGGVLADLC